MTTISTATAATIEVVEDDGYVVTGYSSPAAAADALDAGGEEQVSVTRYVTDNGGTYYAVTSALGRGTDCFVADVAEADDWYDASWNRHVELVISTGRYVVTD